MLLLVYTVVEAPDAGWASPRTLGSFAGAAALLAGSWRWSADRAPARAAGHPALGARSCAPNLGAMALFGVWVGFQFVATLYMQQLRGWSPLETGLAILPGRPAGGADRPAHRRRSSRASGSAG